MIRSANAIASAMADSDAGDGLPSHWASFRAARLLTLLRPQTEVILCPMLASGVWLSNSGYNPEFSILGSPEKWDNATTLRTPH